MTRSTPRGPASAQSGPLTRNAASRIRTSASRPQWPVDAHDAFDAAVAAAYGLVRRRLRRRGSPRVAGAERRRAMSKLCDAPRFVDGFGGPVDSRLESGNRRGNHGRHADIKSLGRGVNPSGGMRRGSADSIASGATVGDGAVRHPLSERFLSYPPLTLGDGVRIGPAVAVAPGAAVGHGTHVDQDTVVGPSARLGSFVRVSSGVRVGGAQRRGG